MPAAAASFPAQNDPTPRWTRLLLADPDLAEGIPADERRLAEDVVRAEVRTLECGSSIPSLATGARPGAWALLLLDGVVVQEVAVADRVSTQLLGPGDLLRPEPASDPFLPREVRWNVVQPVPAAVLDDRFELAARRWPSLSRHIADRLLAQNERVTVQLAIAQLPRIEQRVLAMLWHLAARWGRVTSDGYVVPLRLTHEALGHLVGARRPTVSLAIAALARAGHVHRRHDGTWVLDPASSHALERGALLGRPHAGEALERAAG